MTDLVPVGDEEEIQDRIDGALEAMAPQKAEFLEATVDHLGVWLWEESDGVISQEPKRAVRLGKRRLKRLRKRLTKLERKLPKIVKKRIGKKEFWAHQSSAPDVVLNIKGGAGFKNPYRPTREPLPRLLQDAFGHVLTRLGKTHRRFRLGKARWRKSRTVSGVLDYRGTFQPSEEMTGTLERYADTADELRAALQDMDRLQAEDLRRRAEDLWQVGG